ncbi:MAG: four helix bundle protein [Bacteroidota bacterium]|nr:four helix bundle protein [Bacteroidota bacterium]
MFRELLAYKKAFNLALEIHEISKKFPSEEVYSLTSQIRRSSRSVCSSVGEAYRKRVYPKHFKSKLTDADSENSETIVWLDFSLAFKYINEADHIRLLDQAEEVGKLIQYMINNCSKFMQKQ